MNKQSQSVSVAILGKEYKIACSEDEKDALLDSVSDLDKRMRKIRDTGKVNSPDRIAVMVALNLMHELRQAKGGNNSQTNSITYKLSKLRHKIENVLENS